MICSFNPANANSIVVVRMLKRVKTVENSQELEFARQNNLESNGSFFSSLCFFAGVTLSDKLWPTRNFPDDVSLQ